jgi:hypothetical protein
VSDFVNGLVRRGAGLPSPVAVLPASGTRLTGNALPPVEAGLPGGEEQIAQIVEQNATALGEPASTARTPPSAARQPAGPTPAPHAEAVQWQTIPTRIESHVSLSSVGQHADAPATREVAPAIDSPGVAASEPGKRLALSPCIPADQIERKANSSAAFSQTIPQPGKQSSQPPEIHPGVAEFRAAMPVREQKPEAMAPRPTASSLPSVASHETARESRTIQVRIGKVEIRSSQPPTVVQAIRRAPTTAFDDLKMVRNYFSRG